jgi:hypothetical protein
MTTAQVRVVTEIGHGFRNVTVVEEYDWYRFGVIRLTFGYIRRTSEILGYIRSISEIFREHRRFKTNIRFVRASCDKEIEKYSKLTISKNTRQQKRL